MAEPARAALDALRARYAKQVVERVAALAERWSAIGHRLDDMEVVRDLEVMAHNLAGAGTTFGFPAVSAVAQALEQVFARALDPDASLEVEPPERISALIGDLGRAAARPAEYPGAPAGIETAAEGPEREQRLALIAEDDPVQAKQLADELGHFAIRAHLVTCFDDLPREVAAARPDVILVDIISSAGRSHGLDVVDALARDDGDRTPIIFTSVRDDFEARLGAVRAGASGYFVKPIDTLKLVERIDQMTARGKTEPYRVLIVEDDALLAEAYAMALESAGMVTQTVAEPERVTDHLEELDADLILMDLYLPRCSGLDLARVVRQQDAFAGVPIVYLSTEARLDRQLYAMSLGGDDFLTKPIDPDHLVAAVSSRVQRARTLRSFIDRDAMTGLFNHAAILASLDIELSRARRTGDGVVFALVDLDHFKSVNDTYGHPTGDRVLKRLARMLQQRLRKTDLVGRYGGEEFALILPGTNEARAREIIDDLRERFSTMRQVSESREFKVTFSAGLASYPGHAQPGDLAEAADRALYRSKSAGRNRVSVDVPGPSDA